MNPADQVVEACRAVVDECDATFVDPEEMSADWKRIEQQCRQALASYDAARGQEESTTDDAKWLIYSREHNAWMAPNSQGYTNSITKAGRYPLKEASQICVGAGLDSDDAANEFMHLAPEFAFNNSRLQQLEQELARLKRIEEAAKTVIGDREGHHEIGYASVCSAQLDELAAALAPHDTAESER